MASQWGRFIHPTIYMYIDSAFRVTTLTGNRDGHGGLRVFFVTGRWRMRTIELTSQHNAVNDWGQLWAWREGQPSPASSTHGDSSVAMRNKPFIVRRSIDVWQWHVLLTRPPRRARARTKEAELSERCPHVSAEEEILRQNWLLDQFIDDVTATTDEWQRENRTAMKKIEDWTDKQTLVSCCLLVGALLSRAWGSQDRCRRANEQRPSRSVTWDSPDHPVVQATQRLLDRKTLLLTLIWNRVRVRIKARNRVSEFFTYKWS